jgi:hypothetical protein
VHRHGGPGRGKADQDSLTQVEERTHLCRNLRAQRAERRAQSALANCSLSRFGSLAQRIRSGKSAGKKFDREKLASFGPLCLSSDSTRCQESESLSDFKNRRAVRPYFNLPFWTLYFRHYEVGAPCRRAVVWDRRSGPGALLVSMTHLHRALWLQRRRVASGPEGRGPAVLQLS